ncbi:MAG: Ig-like domain-containing protein [Acidobacteria bacterium]|nr:Ig-like domain-containing protein [Acidobacteriota bacterium]
MRTEPETPVQAFDCDLEPASATNAVGTSHTVTATITYQGLPLPNRPVFFRVASGPNAGITGSGVTDSNGMASFTYTSNGQLGTDTITVSLATSPCDSATKIWIPDQDGDGVPDASEQPSNIVACVFDERDLLFTSTRGGLTDQFRNLAAHADISERNHVPNSRDLSTFTRAYDLNRNLKQSIDGADNTGDGQPEATTYLYDGFDCRIRREITPATSDTPHPAGGLKDQSMTWTVIGTTLQEFQYDGLSRLTRSFDNNEPADSMDDAIVNYAYDSLSRLLEEVQNDQAVSSRWAGDNDRIGLVYPNGREIEFTFDQLDRIDQIRNPQSAIRSPIVDYNYIGPGRVLERIYANGVRLTYLDDARQRDVGYDDLKRIIQLRHLTSNNSLVAGFASDYDRANNQLFEVKQHDNNRREDYRFDSIYRLERFARQGEPADTWQLDGAGNWASRQGVLNQANNVNEYAAFSRERQLHDDNGNLIEDDANRYQYDFANRLRKVIRKADNAVIAVYRYEAHNRRIERIVTNTANLNDQVRYFYDGWRRSLGRMLHWRWSYLRQPAL